VTKQSRNLETAEKNDFVAAKQNFALNEITKQSLTLCKPQKYGFFSGLILRGGIALLTIEIIKNL
jgi:hypothetical protein